MIISAVASLYPTLTAFFVENISLCNFNYKGISTFIFTQEGLSIENLFLFCYHKANTIFLLFKHYLPQNCFLGILCLKITPLFHLMSKI